jgi:hypothetical protein
LYDFGYEIDFLPVGNGDKSGDAIALRYGTPGNYTIHVVDGGTLESGDALVSHINEYYGYPGFIDHVVCTHPDGDHASGLRRILENFQVGTLWMNRPWLYAEDLLPYFRDQRITADSLKRRFREAYPYIDQLEALALQNQVQIKPVFQGDQVGAFTVLSPSINFYHSLILQSIKTPDTHTAADQNTLWLRKLIEAAANWVSETWFGETLREGGETSAENESSVIQIAEFGNRRILLTGDAGLRALNAAAELVQSHFGYIPDLHFIQIPHHGSRNNVSPTILNRWIGSPLVQGQFRNLTAFASASAESSTHPRKAVINAFIRRGAKVVSTKGSAKRHSYNMPSRDGWSGAMPESFSNQVEPYTDASRSLADALARYA